MVPLLQFLVCASVVSYMVFVLSLFVLLPLVPSGGLCIVIVPFPGYLHFYFWSVKEGNCVFVMDDYPTYETSDDNLAAIGSTY